MLIAQRAKYPLLSKGAMKIFSSGRFRAKSRVDARRIAIFQRRAAVAILRGDHLGENRDGDLFRRFRADVESDRRVQPIDGLDRNAGVDEALTAQRLRLLAADRADVAHVA